MRALCEANRVRFHHVLQPNQYVPGSKAFAPGERELAWRPGKPMRPHVEKGYPLLRDAGRELREAGVRFHDLTQVFAEVSDPVYIDDCCHFGQRGTELLADAIGQAILADERGG